MVSFYVVLEINSIIIYIFYSLILIFALTSPIKDDFIYLFINLYVYDHTLKTCLISSV